MPSKRATQKFAKLLHELKQDPNVLAFWLSGSGGKGLLTKYSDYDLVIIVKDRVKKRYEKKYIIDFEDSEFDLAVKTLTELKQHALSGSETAWDRFNYAYVKVIFDRTGKVQKIINQKAQVSKREARQIIDASLDAFINQVYRAAKCKRAGNLAAAHFEMAEAIPWFLNCIFALEGRIRPYAKYLEWDLKQHPLRKLPWQGDVFVEKLLRVLQRGDEKTLLELLNKTRHIFKEAGYKAIYDSWKGKYRVEE